MGPAEESRCCHQLQVRSEGNEFEPCNICSCPAGLIHMHDCPVLLGLDCVHFVPVENGQPGRLDAKEHEQLHDELMDDFLSRPYVHRVRSLAPAGDAWAQRRAELAQLYDDYAEPDDAPDEVSPEFEAERERLLKIRQRKDEQRREREEEERKRREARAKEQAERLVRVAERRAAARAERKAKERLRRADAEPGQEGKRRRRRRRKSKPKQAEGAAPGPEPRPAAESSGDAGNQPRRRRRRRGRRRRPKGGDASA